MSGGMRGGRLSGALVVSVLLALGVLGAPAVAGASAGALDDGFGGGGKVLTDVGPHDSASGVAVQSDGKLVVVGADSALLRYNPDGTLDASFGSGGKVTALIQPKDVALQADGKIVVSGSAPSGDFAVARYNRDGTPDTSFGVGGKAVTSFPPPPSADRSSSRGVAEDVVIQPDGKIVASGENYVASFGTITRRLALARYNTDGSLDTTFGAPNGYTITNLDSGNCGESSVVRVALDPADGGIMVATRKANQPSPPTNVPLLPPSGGIVPAGPCAFFLARFTTLGSPDPSFGGSGSVTTNIRKSSFDNSDSRDSAEDLAIQPDGKIVAAGWSAVRVRANGTTSDFSFAFALARYTRAGTLDPTFGNLGLLVTSFGPQDALGHAIAIQPADGDIVVGGQTLAGRYPDYVGDFALARYKPDGSLDTGFGSGGKVLTDFDPGRRDSAYDIALQGDGKIVAVGESSSRPITGQPEYQGSADFALARYRIDSPPNPGGTGTGAGTGTGTGAGTGAGTGGNPPPGGGSNPPPGGGSSPPPGGGSSPPPGGGSNPPPGGGGAGRHTTAPVVSGFGLTNNPFVVGGSTPIFAVAAAKNTKKHTKNTKRHKLGTTFVYTLSEAATVRIVITEARSGRRRGKRCVAPTRSLRRARKCTRTLTRSGRRQGKRCVAPTRKLRKAKKCTRIITKGTLTRTSHQGKNRVAFSGRIGSRKLAPGRYQATITATDAARNTSKPRTITFMIVRR